MPKKLRVFLDTSALIAGLNSPSGAAGVVLAACFAGEVVPIISPQVVKEMEANIHKKFPKLSHGWINFLLIPPEVTSTPSLKAIRDAYDILPTSDAPILASAIAARPDFLITWNTRDFQRKKVIAFVEFPMLTPGEFLNAYRSNF